MASPRLTFLSPLRPFRHLPSPCPARFLCTLPAVPQSFRVLPHESSLRLDKLLSLRFPNFSRTHLQTLFTSNLILLNSNPPPSKSHKPCADDVITLLSLPPPPIESALTPKPLPLSVIFSDDHIIVVNKPANLIVHPSTSNPSDTLVNVLIAHYPDLLSLGGPRPGIVHRLDKGTSGVLVVARTSQAYRHVQQQFAQRQVRKKYITIAVGNPCTEGCHTRIVREPIGRSERDRLKMEVREDGKHAVSLIKVHSKDSKGLLHALSVDIETGRTHQIRVHLKHCRAPVLGDETYGNNDINHRFRGKATRPLLHAWRIEIQHPVTGQRMGFEAKLPDDMRQIMKRVVYPDFENEGW